MVIVFICTIIGAVSPRSTWFGQVHVMVAILITVARGTGRGRDIGYSAESIIQSRSGGTAEGEVGSITEGDQLASHIFIGNAACNSRVRGRQDPWTRVSRSCARSILCAASITETMTMLRWLGGWWRTAIVLPGCTPLFVRSLWGW